MIKTVIVEDEQHCVDRLKSLLSTHYPLSVEVLAACKTVDEGLNAIGAYHPDLVFLDVKIQDQTGFDLLDKLKEIAFEVIFTTAYEKYAVQAFRFSAIDYLLKPIDPDDLKQAIDKLKDKISKDELAKKFDVLFHNLKNLEGASKKISIPTVNGLVFVQIDDIMRCKSEINYTSIFLKDKSKITVAKTLKEFEELLTTFNFYRVHNSHLINLAFVKSYHKGKGGYVSMADGSEIEVSTRRKESFLKKLSDHFHGLQPT